MKRTRNILISAIIFLTLLAIIAGKIYTKNIYKNVAEGIENELKSIAELKANNLFEWYSDELNDVDYISQSTTLIQGISQFLKVKNTENENYLSEHLSDLAIQHSYSNIVLFDTNSQIVWSLKNYTISQTIDSIINTTIASKQKQALSFQKSHDQKQLFSIDFSAPILNANKQVIGAFLYSIDPETTFFPAFTNWPGAGVSGEVLLFKKAGDSIIFINNYSQNENNYFSFSLPLSHNEFVSVQGTTGGQNIVYGKDYYGNNVISYVKDVADTDWFVLVKIDEDEVFSSLKAKAVFFYLVLLFFILLIIFVFAYYYRTSQSKLYQKLFLANEVYKTTLYSIGDAVITTDTEGKVKNLNSVAERLTGWNELDAINKPVEDVFRIINEETREKIESPFKKVIEDGVVVGLANHTLLISKDNILRPIADSGAPIFDSNGKLSGVVVVFRDQSLEHEQEKKIDEHRRQMQTLLSNLPGMAYRCQPDSKWTMKFVSNGCLLLTGYWSKDLINNNIISYNSLILPQYREKVYQTIDDAIKNNKSFELEYEIKTKSGDKKWVWEKGRAIYNDHGKVYALEGFINDITERIKIEHELEDSRVLFKNLATNASVGIFKTDVEGKTVFVNSKWCELAGCSESEALGLQWLNRIHPDDRDTVHKNWLKIINSKENYATEYRFLHENNKIIWVQGQVSPEFDANQNLIGFIGTVTDITKRILAEQTLTYNNNLLHTIIENIPDTIYMKDAQGRKIIANHNDVLVCGAESFDEIKGKTDFEMFPKEFAEKYWADDQLVIKEGKSIINQKEHVVTKKGKEEWLQTSKIPLKNEHGEIIGLVGLGHNVTNQMEAEKERSKLSTAIEQTPLNIIITNIEGVIEYVNHNFVITTGFNMEEVVGNKPNILKSGTHTKELYNEMWSMLKRGYDWRGELENKKKNGELYWVNVIISPVKNQLGETINYVAVEEDITYKKELIEELVDAKNKAEESDKLKTSFLANMSHEIRTPLNSILGFTDLLKETETLSIEDRKQFSSIIEKSAESLLQIINDIIDISSLETNQLSIHLSTFSLNNIIRALYREYADLASTSPHNIDIRVLTLDVQLDITTDRNRLNQIFVNLLNNALKFTPEGYIEFGVTGYDNNYIYFKVEDTGIGIEETHKEAIFDRFRQVESSSTRKFGGNGLGLSIVKNLVGVMGGEITLKSEVGKGSCFSFYLPKAKQ
ncbi:MAG: PAS domain S-box protein [Prolixibacteraceae bacterium]|jgi:PAS domain S-box-containing protein|nr:PAS domain S-box protein [Prolixibacteraceae bacterium]